MIAKLTTLAGICLGALPVWLLLRRPWKHRPILREIMLGLFVIFMVGILTMALEGRWQHPADMLTSALERLKTGEKIHPAPFHTIGAQLRSIQQETSLTQLLGNVFLFSPWGFCLPLLWRRYRGFWKMAGMSLALTAFIEFTQLFIDRYVELDDIMLNFLGSMLGAGVWRLLHRFWPKTDCLAK